MRTRRARTADVAAIHRLIAHYAGESILLPRDEADIRRHLRGFLVLAEAEHVIACVSLEAYHSSLAEIRSLAVTPDARGRGLGGRLMKAALALAERQHIARIFALTGEPEFFLRHGFELSSRHALHEKIDRDCVHCEKARTCRLSAVILNLAPMRRALNILEDASCSAPVE
jgi:amino-acid N-acetyltransferase